MLESPLFMQGNTYAARRLRELVGYLFDVEGVIKPETGALKVAPRAAGANMSVDVARGSCAILGDDAAGQGMYVQPSTAVENLPIGAAPGSNSRIDLVIARIRDATVTGGVSNDWVLEVIPGEVAAAPVAPPVPASAIPLGQVLVAAGVVSIGAAKITDRRAAAANAAYEPKQTEVFVSASAMSAVNGVPTLGVLGSRHPVWLMDSATIENVAGGWYVPAGWATVVVDLLWSRLGTGAAGEVRWQVVLDYADDLEQLDATGPFVAQTASTPAQNALRRTRIGTAGVDAFPVTPDGWNSIRVQRIGSDAADTFTEDAALLGARIRKVA